MKTIYEKPEVTAIELLQTQVLCSSIEELDYRNDWNLFEE